MIPIENSNQIGIIVGSSISIFIATTAVGLRLVAKRIGVGFDHSDYCIVAALLCNTALHTCGIVMVTHGGFGFHTLEVYQRFGSDTAIFFFKGIMSFALLWNGTVCFSKLSVLFMYTALIPVPSLQKWAKGIGALIILWNLSDVMAGLLICRPIAKNWNFALPGTCGSQPKFYSAMGVINLITDAVIIVLPMPYLFKLRMAMRKKIVAMALLSIGVGTWVITIYRQTLLPGLDFTDMTYSGVLATILSGLEPAVAIVLACIPLMRPLLGRRSTSLDNSRYKYSTRRTSRSYSKGLDTTTAFTEIADDNDASSQVQLQPLEASHAVESSVAHENSFQFQDGRNIVVNKSWEVSRS